MVAHGLPVEAFEIVVISVAGDRIQDRALSELGGKGLFTKEIEDGLLERRIDIAVHSSKDMPTTLPAGLELSAFLPREDARDAFVGGAAATIAALPRGATIGSSSLRRQALIRRMRPDLSVITFRGNVQTRLRKLASGVADGTMLALAGLRRLSLEHVATEVLDVEAFPPAPGQGAICIEGRIGDERVARLLSAIHHVPTGQALICERAFLAALDGSCRTPIAGHARVADGTIGFSGLILTPDGRRSHEITLDAPVADAAALGQAAGDELRARAGPEFFAEWLPDDATSTSARRFG